MSDKIIDRAQIEKIAELASLELSDAEKEAFVGQFEDILGYFKTIDSAPLEELHDHDVDAQDHLRDDEARVSDVDPEKFSPYMESGHFKVPKVIE